MCWMEALECSNFFNLYIFKLVDGIMNSNVNARELVRQAVEELIFRKEIFDKRGRELFLREYGRELNEAWVSYVTRVEEQQQ